jgi:hypothetical protein
MVVTLLAAVTLQASLPTLPGVHESRAPAFVTSQATQAWAPARALPRVTLGEGDQGVGRGVRQVLLGTALAAGGLALGLVALVIFMGGFATAGVLVLLGLGSGAAPVAAIGGLVAVALAMVGGALLVAGGLWAVVNGGLVLLRLSPGYKPGPATEYLDW